MSYLTKKLQEILDKSKFSIGKIKTKEYLHKGVFPIIDQGKSLIGGYSNNKDLVYNGKLPVLVYGDHTNIVKYIDFKFIGGADGIKVLPFSDGYDVKYCYYLLENFKPKTQGYRRHFSFFKEINLPLPPLPTQKLIVQKLDSAFKNIDESIKITKKNIENIEELNKSVLETIFKESKYEIKNLGDLFKITSSKRVFKSEWKEKGIPFYRAREIVKLAKYGYVDNDLFITKEMFEEYSDKYGIPKEGDIMVTGVGTLGICYVVKKGDKFYFKDGNIIWFKNKSDKVFSRYIEYGFSSKYVKIQVLNTTGTSVGTYTIVRAKNTKIPLPPLAKQKEIVEYLDEVFEKNKVIKEGYEKKLKDLEEMKQSILKEAFEGRLVE